MMEADIQAKRELGTPLTIGNVQLAVESHAVIVQWTNGGLVWNRPKTVHVIDGNQTQTLPIKDPTRRAQIALYGIAVFALLASALHKRGKSNA